MNVLRLLDALDVLLGDVDAALAAVDAAQRTTRTAVVWEPPTVERIA